MPARMLMTKFTDHTALVAAAVLHTDDDSLDISAGDATLTSVSIATEAMLSDAASGDRTR